MSIYFDLISKVTKEKASFKIDLNKGKLTTNRKNIKLDTKDVKLINSEDLKHLGIEDCLLNPYETLEVLYHQFKHSVPSEKKNRSYFKGLDIEELSDYEMVNSIRRREAQAYLEGFILLGALSGHLKWINEEHWFYQGKDKNLIIFKKWIEKGEKNE